MFSKDNSKPVRDGICRVAAVKEEKTTSKLPNASGYSHHRKAHQ